MGNQAPLVGTNLAVPSITNLTSAPPLITALGGYLDFTTGAYTGTDASGDLLYGPGGNFYILDGPLNSPNGVHPALAKDTSTGSSVIKSLGGGVYELTMNFSNAYLSTTIAGPLGVTPGFGYDGVMDFQFVVNPSLAGNQLLSGTISFSAQAIPEPNSLVLMSMGTLGLLGLVRHRRSPRALTK